MSLRKIIVGVTTYEELCSPRDIVIGSGGVPEPPDIPGEEIPEEQRSAIVADLTKEIKRRSRWKRGRR